MAAKDSHFSQTDWSMVGRLTGADEVAARDALERLVRRYWPAVYAFVRRTGRDVHEASDLTQAFVADIVLGRRLIHGADPARGRLRHLLLGALRNFLHEVHRHQGRLKRSPAGAALVSLDAVAPPTEAGKEATPDEAFDAAWCRTLVQVVLSRVQAECRRDGLDMHWAVFEARVARPVLHATVPIEYETLAGELGLSSAAHAANLLVTVKRRFVRALRREIAETVGDETQVEAELVEVLRRAGG